MCLESGKFCGGDQEIHTFSYLEAAFLAQKTWQLLCPLLAQIRRAGAKYAGGGCHL